MSALMPVRIIVLRWLAVLLLASVLGNAMLFWAAAHYRDKQRLSAQALLGAVADAEACSAAVTACPSWPPTALLLHRPSAPLPAKLLAGCSSGQTARLQQRLQRPAICARACSAWVTTGWKRGIDAICYCFDSCQRSADGLWHCAHGASARAGAVPGSRAGPASFPDRITAARCASVCAAARCTCRD